jgi:hypothetical protein
MSFNNVIRRARDLRLSFPHRVCLFRACALRMSELCQVRRSVILTHYCERFAIKTEPDTFFLHITETQLWDALKAIEVDRNRILDALRGFQRMRIREKMRGRQTMSKAQSNTLVNDILSFLFRPSPGISGQT